MSISALVEPTSALTRFGNVVPNGYHYTEKQVSPDRDLRLPTAYLKWYNIYPPDAPLTSEQQDASRAFVTQEVARLAFDDDLGFVLLHRAGSVLLLMIVTWRNTNELWESVYVTPATDPTGYTLVTFPSTHRATFCVWELSPVWHERNAWVRFLASTRDDAAKQAYVNDRFTGLV